MRVFYLEYQITQTVSAELQVNSETVSRNLPVADFKLSWSHYHLLLRIDNKEERQFYQIEASKNQWSLRELKRQFDSALYLRLALSTDKEGIKTLTTQGQLIETPKDAIKDPYILEFLDLKEQYHYSESELENELIEKLENFLLELGKGFTFVARQKRITFEEKNFYMNALQKKHRAIGHVTLHLRRIRRLVPDTGQKTEMIAKRS